MSAPDDVTGMRILEEINQIATTTNALYDSVNARTAGPEEIRARLTVARAHLDRIEEFLYADVVLRGVPTP